MGFLVDELLYVSNYTATNECIAARMQRLKNKIFLCAFCKGNEMTAEEEERGRRLQLARLKKNEKQRIRNRQTAGEKMKWENVCLTVTDGCKGEKVAAVKQCKRNCQTAGEKMKLEYVCLTVTDGCEGEKVAAVKVKALYCFEGCNNEIRAGRVCSRHGAEQIRIYSKEDCTKQAQSRGVCVAHGAKTKLCSHEGCTKQVVRGGKCKDNAGPAETFDGSCSIEGCHNSGAMIKVNKVLVCMRYPCMSHSGKGVRCSAKGCPKYVTPVLLGETRQMMCVFNCDMAHERCSHQGCVNVALQGGACYCHGANTKLCCNDVRLFDESTKKWKVS
jgi:hypothetical protein